MISISKAKHLPLFRNRGSGDLGNGLLRAEIVLKSPFQDSRLYYPLMPYESA